MVVLGSARKSVPRVSDHMCTLFPSPLQNQIGRCTVDDPSVLSVYLFLEEKKEKKTHIIYIDIYRCTSTLQGETGRCDVQLMKAKHWSTSMFTIRFLTKIYNSIYNTLVAVRGAGWRDIPFFLYIRWGVDTDCEIRIQVESRKYRSHFCFLTKVNSTFFQWENTKREICLWIGCVDPQRTWKPLS